LLELFSMLRPSKVPERVVRRVIAWVLRILELVAGVLGSGVGLSRLPDAASALGIATPTAFDLVGLLAFFRHFVFHQSDAERLGWESTGPKFQYEVGFANLAFALVAFSAYFGGWPVGSRWSSATGCTSRRLHFSTPGSPCAWTAAWAASFKAPCPR
jgi:hypothetical protein